MTAVYQQEILIAGMGVTGRSVARFLKHAGIEFSVCDDDPGRAETACAGLIKSWNGYVFKSPGIPDPGWQHDRSWHRLINDIEMFMRLDGRPKLLVTGTNGKTTVVSAVEHILGQCGIYAIACGNNGVPVLDVCREPADVFVLELSSYQLEVLTTIHSDAAVLLNIAHDHLDRHDNMARYLSIKEKIYENAASAVIPVNKQGEREYGKAIAGYRLSGEEEGHVYQVGTNGLLVDGEQLVEKADIPLRGNHNHLNLCAALCLCHQYGLDRQQLVAAVASFTPPEHRLETVCTDRLGREWINDSKSTNVHSTSAALDAFDGPVVLIMGGQMKKEDYSTLFNANHERIFRLYLYGQDAGQLDRQAVQVKSRVRTGSLEEAVSLVNQQVGHEMPVLFSPGCASYDQYRNYVERGEDFRRCVQGIVK